MRTSPHGAPRLPSSSPEPDASVPEQRTRNGTLFGVLLSLCAAVVALTCAGRGAVARGPDALSSASVPSVPRVHAPRVPVTGDPVHGAPKASAASTESRERRTPELTRFFDALESLRRGERDDSVRILWIGDSHTAADYLSGSVRSSLARQYKSGGPGFLRLGVHPYRHDGATLGRSGRFRIEPEPPARRSRQGDGIFGLGGLRVSPRSEGARATVKLAEGTVFGMARFELLFDLPSASEFSVTLGSQRLEVRDEKAAIRVPNSPILRVRLEGDPKQVFAVETRRGRPRFYGVIVEGSEPGVVLDTLGIDGARIATTLAWAEAPFVAEVAARNPDLAVIAFGTNEAFDGLRVSAYDQQLSALLARIRSGAPRADCLVLGPPDALSPGGDSAPRVAGISAVYAGTAQALGCAFVSQQELMGGPGSFVSWMREDPPLASPDRIHLTLKGYRRLGELISEFAFGEGAPFAAGAPAASR